MDEAFVVLLLIKLKTPVLCLENAVAQLIETLRYRRKVAGSTPDGVTRILSLP
jgi:hypothetical protein